MPIYLSAVLFLACSALSFILAFANWDGSQGSAAVIGALPGLSFSGDISGNIDFAISATMTVACSTAAFAVLQMFRLAFARWILVVIGAVVVIAYIYQLVDLLSNEGGDFIGLLILALALWIAAVVVAVLPVTNRAFAIPRRRAAAG
jgi:hypothetical protein